VAEVIPDGEISGAAM